MSMQHLNLIVAPAVPENFRLTVLPASVTLRKRKVLSSIFKAVEVPVVASIKMPWGHPIMIELKIDMPEFLLICAPQRNKLLPVLLNVALGPIAVIVN
jgi:hypothetical protein